MTDHRPMPECCCHPKPDGILPLVAERKADCPCGWAEVHAHRCLPRSLDMGHCGAEEFAADWCCRYQPPARAATATPTQPATDEEQR